jgi:hypothetical protein
MPDRVLIPQFAAMTNRRSLLAASVSAGAALMCAPALAVSPPEQWGDDGRSGAPAGPVVDAALLDGYATRPPWQVAGVDYHVGIDRTRYPTDASLKPVGTATLPPGVTRDTSQAAYNHKQILVTADNVTLDGYDFSGGWMLNMGPCSGLTISNCRFCVGDTNAGPAGPNQMVSIHRFNVWENTSTGYRYFGGHGDYAQLFQFAGYGYSSVTFDFNTIKITDANCMTQPFSIMSASANQAPALQVNLRYNTVAGKIRRSTNYALAVMDGSWIAALTASYNYIDPTCTWNSKPSEWCYCVVHGMSIQQGPYNPVPVAVGNINMLNGLIMPAVVTKRGH